MSRCILASLLALTLAGRSAHAQLPSITDASAGAATAAAGPLPQWDVAVVKPHSASDGMMSWRITPDGLSLINLPLEQLICNAWDLKAYQLSGVAGWMKTSSFDLTAKVSPEDAAAYGKLNVVQRRIMLQKLLTERFQLKVHTETKTLPIYDLVLDKGGPKLRPTTALDAPSDEERKANPDKYRKGLMSMGPGMFQATGVPVASLASQLANALGRTVHDATGLTGAYDITLHYRREEVSTDISDLPPLLVALQEQLGLKLIPSKGPVETLIVDSAQKPDAN